MAGRKASSLPLSHVTLPVEHGRWGPIRMVRLNGSGKLSLLLAPRPQNPDEPDEQGASRAQAQDDIIQQAFQCRHVETGPDEEFAPDHRYHDEHGGRRKEYIPPVRSHNYPFSLMFSGPRTLGHRNMRAMRRVRCGLAWGVRLRKGRYTLNALK